MKDKSSKNIYEVTWKADGARKEKYYAEQKYAELFIADLKAWASAIGFHSVASMEIGMRRIELITGAADL